MELNENTSELIGAYLGDGYIYRKNRKYQIGFTGNIVTDKEYFDYLRDLLLKEFSKEVIPKERSGGLRITFYSKKVCEFLLDEIGLPHGEGKCEKAFIPNNIISDWGLCKNLIRGLFDTDGSVFVSKKPRLKKYPSIELTTCSKKLVEQVKEILEKQGFRVSNIWSFDSKKSKRTGYRVGLNGQDNLKRWINEIGFSNPWKMQRAISYLK
jgi:DNA-binding transcriptional regulator WhiA